MKMTLIELMMMHRRIFSLIENLHDLLCKGNKDYKEALANVQDYNMTKILTKQSSLPDPSGDIKLYYCDLNTLFNVQMDLELYNYIDVIIHEYRAGELADSLAKAKKADLERKVGNHLINSGLVVNTMDAAPPGMTFKRDNADFMNNLNVNVVARAFTYIDEFIK
jgi:hypothetical protein